jgi:hypothetical protein
MCGYLRCAFARGSHSQVVHRLCDARSRLQPLSELFVFAAMSLHLRCESKRRLGNVGWAPPARRYRSVAPEAATRQRCGGGAAFTSLSQNCRMSC